MDILFLSLMILLPVAAMTSWFTGLIKNANSLVVITMITGVCLYVCSSYAIHANGEQWGDFLIAPEIQSIVESGFENEKELIEEARTRKGRRLHSMTSLSLPLVTAGWYALVLLGGLAFQQIWKLVTMAWSMFRPGRRNL